MKGLKLLTIVVVGLLCLTGCGEKTLTCTNTEEDNGVKMVQEAQMTFKDDQVTKVRMSIEATATDNDIKEYWGSFISAMESQYEEVDEEGVKLTLTNDEKNYKFNMTVEVDVTKASEDALVEYDLEQLADTTATLEEVKKEAEADGFTCK